MHPMKLSWSVKFEPESNFPDLTVFHVKFSKLCCEVRMPITQVLLLAAVEEEIMQLELSKTIVTLLNVYY